MLSFCMKDIAMWVASRSWLANECFRKDLLVYLSSLFNANRFEPISKTINITLPGHLYVFISVLWYEINVGENRRDNQEWTIQIHWQHWAHKIQDKDKPQHNTTPSVRLYSHVVLSRVHELLMLFVFIYVSNLISVSDDVDIFQHQQEGYH